MNSPTIELTPERWAKVDQLYHRAAELDGKEQLAFLEDECAGDTELRNYLIGLLQVDVEGADSANTIVAETMRGAFGEVPPDSMFGQRIGSYRVLRILGTGGMGIVYLAERADDQFEQDVAIKLGRHRLVDPQAEVRLRTERQILSDLDHPNIARLLDGGTIEDGVPYLVIEYINGVRVDTYCDLHRLSIGDRLGLFLSICSAVHYAHQNLVIHRDLKAANILVTEAGTAKLLDFGIAKLIDTGDEPALTQEGAVVMTPANAAPEQVKNEPVTTSTDVYMLGLLLYDLMSGYKAFDPTGLTPSEFAMEILENEVQAPSRQLQHQISSDDSGIVQTIAGNRATTPERLVRALRGDIDTIVGKALRKEPGRRYRSVNALAHDIELHLRGMPIDARVESLRYRTSKFVRRHYAAVTASVAVFVALLGFSIALTVQNRIVVQERDTAREISQFLEDVFMAQDPAQTRGTSITADEILATGAARVQDDLNDRPEIQSALMGTIGRVYFNLGVYDKSSRLLDEALRLQEQIAGKNAPEVADLQVDLAESLIQVPDYDRAKTLLTDALETNRRNGDPVSAAVAENLLHLAELHLKLGELDLAENFAVASVDTYEQLDADHRIAYANSTNLLARILQVRGDLDRTETLMLRAIDILAEAGGSDHPTMAYYLQNLGVLQHSKGDLAAAEITFNNALETTERIFGDEHRLYAGVLRDQGLLLHARGNLRAANLFLRDSLQIYELTLGPLHPMVGYDLTALGRVLHDAGELIEAELMLIRAIEIYDAAFDSGHQYTASAMTELGAVMNSAGRPSEAESVLANALEIRVRDYAADHELVVSTQTEYADALLRLGRLEEAGPLLQKSVEILSERPGRRLDRAVAARERYNQALESQSPE